jgi:VanZ family protein
MNWRRLLHQFRRLDAWLVPPALLVVILGELVHSRTLARLEVDVWDKALHFTAYFGLALMTTIAVRADRRAVWWALGLAVLGGALEIVQGMTGRDADIFDEVANILGVLAGSAIGWAGIAFLKARGLVDDGDTRS